MKLLAAAAQGDTQGRRNENPGQSPGATGRRAKDAANTRRNEPRARAQPEEIPHVRERAKMMTTPGARRASLAAICGAALTALTLTAAGAAAADTGGTTAAAPGSGAAIAAQYPPAAYPSPAVAFSTLAADANFACPALQLDSLTAKRAPTFGYEFNDDSAHEIFVPSLIPPPVATHGSELQYLFDLPNAPVPGTLNPGQQAIAARMQAAWARFAATGNPATTTVPWPAFGHVDRASVLSLVPPQPQLETNFAARHHCSFWAAS
jgi:carboxylesterase type B